MKISLVTETFPPEVNGAAKTLYKLASGLSSRGHELVVIRPRHHDDTPSPNWDQWLVAGWSLPRYPTLRLGLPAGSILTERWNKNRPDVVHVATEGPLGWSAVETACRLGIPVSSSFHTNFHTYFNHYGCGLLSYAALRYLRSIHNRTRRTLVPTPLIQHKLQAAGFHNLGIMGRGVDTELFDPKRRDSKLRRRWGANKDTLVLLYVGRLAIEKNLELVVQSFEAIRQRSKNEPKFILVGDGPERNRLARKYPEYHFVGMQSGEALARHYASGDLFLFPSVTETFGNVVIEAMASGLMVLAYDYAAAGQYIRQGQNGWVVSFNDTQGFIERAVSLVHTGKSEWSSIRRAARNSVSRLSWCRVIESFENELERVWAR